MNAAAERVLVELPDVVVAYGISDEYRYAESPGRAKGLADAADSFVLHRSCTLFERRSR